MWRTKQYIFPRDIRVLDALGWNIDTPAKIALIQLPKVPTITDPPITENLVRSELNVAWQVLPFDPAGVFVDTLIYSNPLNASEEDLLPGISDSERPKVNGSTSLDISLLAD